MVHPSFQLRHTVVCISVAAAAIALKEAQGASSDSIKDLARPQGDCSARRGRHPTELRDDLAGSAKDRVVMGPLGGWLLDGRQVFLVARTTTKVLGCFMFSTGAQVCVFSSRRVGGLLDLRWLILAHSSKMAGGMMESRRIIAAIGRMMAVSLTPVWGLS